MIDSEERALMWLRDQPGYNSQTEERLCRFVEMLRQEAPVQNLVSKESLDSVWTRHIVDSAQLLRFVPRETSLWMDLGTGAGFPGIVIACLRPERPVHLVESRTRRIEWLERLAKSLALENVAVVGSRLERVEPRKASVISARAFAPLAKLLLISERFSTADTLWLLPKGRSAGQELLELRDWRHRFHVEQSITDPEAGIIVGQLLGRKDKPT